MSKYIAHVNIGYWRPEIGEHEYFRFSELGRSISLDAANNPHLKWQFGTQFYQDPNVMRVFNEPRMILNLSVWNSLEALQEFVYRKYHHQAISRKSEWFEPLTVASYVLWWVDENSMPTLEDAKYRLEYFNEHGANSEAFNFDCPYTADGELL